MQNDMEVGASCLRILISRQMEKKENLNVVQRELIREFVVW